MGSPSSSPPSSSCVLPLPPLAAIEKVEVGADEGKPKVEEGKEADEEKMPPPLPKPEPELPAAKPDAKLFAPLKLKPLDGGAVVAGFEVVPLPKLKATLDDPNIELAGAGNNGNGAAFGSTLATVLGFGCSEIFGLSLEEKENKGFPASDLGTALDEPNDIVDGMEVSALKTKGAALAGTVLFSTTASTD